VGSTLVRFVLLFLIVLFVTGCGRMSAETVREKDRQRMEVSGQMPGNDVPPDPADSSR
jgi:hypothetical protein